MSRPHYEEVLCRRALNRVVGMGFRWSLNPYRGCVHGCHYCFARRYHSFLDLSAGEDFTGVILVKVNVAERLREEVFAPSWRREPIALGTATDPYQPIEGKYRLTRRCLEVLAERANPVTLVTKGTMVVRDLDLLTHLARRASVAVCFSVATLDPEVWRRLEPGTPPPHRRLQAMERLARAGVRAGVLLAPVVPGLTDAPAQLEAVVRSAAEHGAHFVEAQVLHLRPGVREHFLAFLARDYPALVPRYASWYPGAYAPPFLRRRVEGVLAGLRARHGLGRRAEPGPVQLTLSL